MTSALQSQRILDDAARRIQPVVEALIRIYQGGEDDTVFNGTDYLPSLAKLIKDANDRVSSASGNVAFVDIKQDAIDRLETYPDQQIIEVLKDESFDGEPRTRYRVESGALVFKTNLDQVREDLNSDAAGKGSDLVKYASEIFAVPYLSLVSEIMQNVPVTPERFVTGPSKAAARIKVQQIREGTYGGYVTDALSAWMYELRGKSPLLSSGIWNHDETLIIYPNTDLRAESKSAILNTDLDIVQIATPDIEGEIYENIKIRGLKLNDSRTLSAAGAAIPVTRSKYQVLLNNTVKLVLEELETACNVADQTNPNINNVGGAKIGVIGDGFSFLAEIFKPWIRNGSLWLQGTDHQVFSPTLWGFANQFAARVDGNNVKFYGGECIPSPGNGGIWVPAPVQFLQVLGMFFDGSNVPGITTGSAIYGALYDATIASCRMWYSHTFGVDLYLAEDNLIVDCNFQNNNRSNGGYSDIRLKPIPGGGCRNNTIGPNKHSNSMSSGAGRGHCIIEDDSDSPGNVKGNTISGDRSYTGGSGYNGELVLVGRSAPAYERTEIGPCKNMRTTNGGSSNVASGSTSRVVMHGLFTAPFRHEITINFVSGALSGRDWWIDNITANSFEVFVSSATVTDANFDWFIALSK